MNLNFLLIPCPLYFFRQPTSMQVVHIQGALHVLSKSWRSYFPAATLAQPPLSLPPTPLLLPLHAAGPLPLHATAAPVAAAAAAARPTAAAAAAPAAA